MIEAFFHLPPVSTTPVVHLELRISPRIFEKIRNGPNGIHTQGLIHEKNQKSKISWHCPFKGYSRAVEKKFNLSKALEYVFLVHRNLLEFARVSYAT